MLLCCHCLLWSLLLLVLLPGDVIEMELFDEYEYELDIFDQLIRAQEQMITLIRTNKYPQDGLQSHIWALTVEVGKIRKKRGWVE